MGFTRLPPHNIQLKVGSVIIMPRNLNQPKLCNGTSLAVKKSMKNFIEATIIIGKFKGEDCFYSKNTTNGN